MTRTPNLVLRRLTVALLAAGPVAIVSAQSFSIGFPVQGQNPYTAPIITVLDHSAPYFYDKNWTQVVAYTGEMGKDRCGPSDQPCGYYNPNFLAQDPSSTLAFIANGSYVGTSADAPDQLKVLNYRGHSGYDYALRRRYSYNRCRKWDAIHPRLRSRQ